MVHYHSNGLIFLHRVCCKSCMARTTMGIVLKNKHMTVLTLSLVWEQMYMLCSTISIKKSSVYQKLECVVNTWSSFLWFSVGEGFFALLMHSEDYPPPKNFERISYKSPYSTTCLHVLSSYACDHAASPRMSVNADFSTALECLALVEQLCLSKFQQRVPANFSTRAATT